eukprot:5014708-Amphidinium_carterae.2
MPQRSVNESQPTERNHPRVMPTTPTRINNYGANEFWMSLDSPKYWSFALSTEPFFYMIGALAPFP